MIFLLDVNVADITFILSAIDSTPKKDESRKNKDDPKRKDRKKKKKKKEKEKDEKGVQCDSSK